MNCWSDFETYLKPVHLKGSARKVTIRAIEIESVFNPGSKRRESAPVAYFEGAQRGMVLGASKRKALARLFGDEIHAAIGKAIVIEPGKNEQGKETILIKPASA